MRRFILAILFIASVSLPGWAHPATAQEVDRNAPVADTSAQEESSSDAIDPLTFYESPTFGYVIPWFEDVWHLEASDSGPDGDVVSFRQENDLITFHGYEGDAGDPDACLSKLVDQLKQTSGANAEPGIDESGNPIEGIDEFYAWAVYVVAPD